MDKKTRKDNSKDRGIFSRYHIVTVLLCLVAVAILFSAVKINIYERENWIDLAKTLEKPDRLVNPTRGNIYSDDDRIMATSMPQYYMYIDFKAEGFARDSFLNSKRNGVDSLAYFLSKKLKNRTPEGYKSHLLKGLKSSKRNYPVYEGRVSYEDLKEIMKFPFLRKFDRNKSGFYTKEMMKRQKPFGMLASRTIGDIYSEIDASGFTKGKNGLELQFDSLLKGSPGVSSVQRVGGRWADVVEVEPENGMDIRSTIDISIQDMVEKALMDKLSETDADAGTAVVMEVKTGEIKAITNMARLGPGRYAETMNHAVADEIEPGSTFKVASMMVAIEDRVVEPNTPVDVGNGKKRVGKRDVTDHNYNRGGYGKINAEQSIWYSSNIGVAELIYNAYRTKPTKYIEGLHKIGMDADLKIGIPGAGKAKLRWPKDKEWSDLSLSTIPYGYEVIIPPIQTLAFFNAIANNGKFVRPLFVKDIIKNGDTYKHFDTEVVIPKICSDRTLKIIQNMLYNVVNYHDPTHKKSDGTGKPAKSDVITIAGKTGTAVRATGGHYRSDGYNVSFCGYFPYENPLYTCIVVISRPRIGTASGGGMCGTVVKEIAEKIYANSTIMNLAEIKADSLIKRYPDAMNGNGKALENVTSSLQIKTQKKDEAKSGYVTTQEHNNGITVKGLAINNKQVPDVIGMGAKDAVYLLESRGLRVSLSGQGRVESQSIRNGAAINPGQTILLTLR
ncbi:MAG: transpeptidase family protein [Tannerella sp.]|jgi:cell division protein FtsI (penicillin-binding protein 3)|nr:transpeptidase family protein [Tannerella sp.]